MNADIDPNPELDDPILTVAGVPAPDGGVPAVDSNPPARDSNAPAEALPPYTPPSPPPQSLNPRRHEGRRQAALLLAASLLSAGLASTATNALDRGATAAVTSAATTASNAGTITTAVAVASTDAIVSATASVSPAVVTITTSSGQSGPFGSSTGTGSGFVYGSDGWILTANHVVDGAGSITVTLADGRSFDGTVAASDATADLAVVKVAATGLPTAKIGSSRAIAPGSAVVAIGDPLGEFSGSVTVGVISGVDRSITVADATTRQARNLTGLLQTDAAINEGNSGGPLVNLAGQVVGIVTAGSSSAQGIGFAIPIDAAKAIMAEAASSTHA